jgi:hypothetical protein
MADQTRECPQCHRWISIRKLAGKRVWAAHKPGRGKRHDCPQSLEPYTGV